MPLLPTTTATSVPIMTATSKPSKKISQRLQQINRLVTKEYQHIWDCCCDHGFLGLTLLERQAAQTIHFVDIAPDILNQLHQLLLTRYPIQGKAGGWQVHCTDVAKLPINEVSSNPESDKHLIIIAGVGGDLTVQLMSEIVVGFSHLNLEFIICPVHHNYKVREYLIKNQFGLISEQLLIENKRGYEILHVSQGVSDQISNIGSEMWDLTRTEHVNHLKKIISHYQRIAKNPQHNVENIIEQYQKLLPTS